MTSVQEEIKYLQEIVKLTAELKEANERIDVLEGEYNSLEARNKKQKQELEILQRDLAQRKLEIVAVDREKRQAAKEARRSKDEASSMQSVAVEMVRYKRKFEHGYELTKKRLQEADKEIVKLRKKIVENQPGPPEEPRNQISEMMARIREIPEFRQVI